MTEPVVTTLRVSALLKIRLRAHPWSKYSYRYAEPHLPRPRPRPRPRPSTTGLSPVTFCPSRAASLLEATSRSAGVPETSTCCRAFLASSMAPSRLAPGAETAAFSEASTHSRHLRFPSPFISWLRVYAETLRLCLHTEHTWQAPSAAPSGPSCFANCSGLAAARSAAAAASTHTLHFSSALESFCAFWSMVLEKSLAIIRLRPHCEHAKSPAHCGSMLCVLTTGWVRDERRWYTVLVYIPYSNSCSSRIPTIPYCTCTNLIQAVRMHGGARPPEREVQTGSPTVSPIIPNLPNARPRLRCDLAPRIVQDAIDFRMTVMQQLLLHGSHQLTARQEVAENLARAVIIRWRFNDEAVGFAALRGNLDACQRMHCASKRLRSKQLVFLHAALDTWVQAFVDHARAADRRVHTATIARQAMLRRLRSSFGQLQCFAYHLCTMKKSREAGCRSNCLTALAKWRRRGLVSRASLAASKHYVRKQLIESWSVLVLVSEPARVWQDTHSIWLRRARFHALVVAWGR